MGIDAMLELAKRTGTPLRTCPQRQRRAVLPPWTELHLMALFSGRRPSRGQGFLSGQELGKNEIGKLVANR